MSYKIVPVQDISCYGQCSLTVALPILSALGVETAILPSAILSTHTGGFTGFTVLDLTEEMPKILKHWINEGIKFDAIYTGYIGDTRQFDIINEAKAKMTQQVVISEAFRSLVTKPECAEKVVTRLHELSDGKQKPRDMMMPMRAAMEAGALRRPTWAEYMSEFGCKRTSKTSLSDYTDPTKNKFEDDPQFWVMVDEFLRLIAR